MITIRHVIKEMSSAHEVDKFGDVFLDVKGCVTERNVSGFLFGEVRGCDK